MLASPALHLGCEILEDFGPRPPLPQAVNGLCPEAKLDILGHLRCADFANEVLQVRDIVEVEFQLWDVIVVEDGAQLAVYPRAGAKQAEVVGEVWLWERVRVAEVDVRSADGCGSIVEDIVVDLIAELSWQVEEAWHGRWA